MCLTNPLSNFEVRGEALNPKHTHIRLLCCKHTCANEHIFPAKTHIHLHMLSCGIICKVRKYPRKAFAPLQILKKILHITKNGNTDIPCTHKHA